MVNRISYSVLSDNFKEHIWSPYNPTPTRAFGLALSKLKRHYLLGTWMSHGHTEK